MGGKVELALKPRNAGCLIGYLLYWWCSLSSCKHERCSEIHLGYMTLFGKDGKIL